ncbi:Tetracycline resistance protein, class C [bacterium HR29]|nr:Tetracycline resistance protein, class C [bacterium HR29]
MRSRPFVVLYAAVFVATMGISMVSPLLPVYAERLGATGIWIGLTFSIFAVTQTLFGPFAGRWSDRWGRKPFIVAGLLLYFAAALGYLTASTFWQVLAFRALSGLGTSLIFSVARAYIGDLVPPRHEGRWFGVFATADIIGFGVGPVMAGIVREVWGFDAVFIGMAALMAGSATIVALLLPARAPRPGSTGATRPAELRFREALADRLVLALTLTMGLTSLSFGATFSFLAVRLEDLGAGPAVVGVAFGAESVASAVVQPLAGQLADRVERRGLLAGGLAASAAMLLLLGATERLAVVIALMLLMGAAGAVSAVATSAMQVVAGRRAGMGTVLGLGSAGNGAGIVLGSVSGGIMVDAFGLPWAFAFGGLCVLAGIPLFLWLVRGEPTHEAALPTAPTAALAEPEG